MKAKLCLHTGGAEVSLEALEATPTPAATDTWHPIAHAALLSMVRRNLREIGMEVTGESHALSKEGLRYFGLLEIRGENADFSRVVGVRNSHDKVFPAGLVVGSSVFICDNLAFSGEESVKRRHTVFLSRDLPRLVSGMVGRLNGHFLTQEKRFNAYREREIGTLEARDLIFRAYRAGCCNKTDVCDVESEFFAPRHPEFSGKNAWSLFNAFTEIGKGNLLALPKKTMALHALMDEVCGLQAVKQTIDV